MATKLWNYSLSRDPEQSLGTPKILDLRKERQKALTITKDV